MRLVRNITLLFVLFIYSFSHSQEDLSALLKEYYEVGVDGKVEIINTLIGELENINPDDVLVLIIDLEVEGRTNNNQNAIAMSKYALGVYFYEKYSYALSIDKLEQAEKYYREYGNDTMLALTYNLIGNINFRNGNISLAESYYRASLKCSEKSKRQDFSQQALYNLSFIDVHNEKYDEAREALFDYIEFYKTQNDSTQKLGYAYAAVGQTYLNEEEFQLATEYLKKSAYYGITSNIPSLSGKAFTNLGIVAYYEDSTELAEQYFRFSIGYAKEEGSLYNISESYYNLASFFWGVEKIDSAIANFEIAIEIAELGNALQYQKDALEQLLEIYADMEDQARQIEILQRIIDVQEKISDQKVENESKLLSLFYESTTKDLDYRNQKRETELKDSTDSIQKTFDYWIYILSLGVVLILGFFLVYKLVQKLNPN